MSRLAVRMVRLRRAGELAASRAEALGASVWAARDAYIVSGSTKNDFFRRKSKTLCNDALHARRRRRRGCASLRENTFLFAHIIVGYKR